MARSIIIDRDLNTAEEESLQADDLVIDLRNSEFTSSKFKDEILNWVDQAHSSSINEVALKNFFSIDGKSYWYHVRFRIFFKLFEQAQSLDRIEDLSILEKADIIFCDASKIDFWRRWTTKAKLIAPTLNNLSKSNSGEVLKRLLFAISDISTASSLLRRKYMGLIYSPMNNISIDGSKAIDRKLESILINAPKAVLKVEYQNLPKFPKGKWFDSFGMKRATDTLFTDSLLLIYLLLNPSSWMKFLSAFKSLNRFKRKHCVDFEFSFQNDEWQKLLSEYIQKSRLAVLQMYVFDKAFSWLMNETHPDFVLATGESNSVGRVFIDAARDSDILSFGSQHGTLYSNNIDYRFPKEEAENKYPDFFFTWGEASLNIVNSAGNQPKEKLIVSGQPEFDLIHDSLTPSTTVEKFKTLQGKEVIFFASQPQPNKQSRIECAKLLASFSRKHNLACVVKLHPNEQQDHLYETYFEQEGIAEQLMYIEENIYPVMLAADYVSTCYSTVAWEAMTLEKPLVIIDPMKLDVIGMSKHDSVFYISNMDSDLDGWKSNLDDHLKKTRLLAEYEFGPRDGKCHERMWTKITFELAKGVKN